MAIYSPLIRQASPFSPPPVPMHPPAQPGRSYQHLSPAPSKQFTSLVNTSSDQVVCLPSHCIHPDLPLQTTSFTNKADIEAGGCGYMSQQQAVECHRDWKAVNCLSVRKCFWHRHYGLKQAYGSGLAIYRANFKAATARHFRF